MADEIDAELEQQIMEGVREVLRGIRDGTANAIAITAAATYDECAKLAESMGGNEIAQAIRSRAERREDG